MEDLFTTILGSNHDIDQKLNSLHPKLLLHILNLVSQMNGSGGNDDLLSPDYVCRRVCEEARHTVNQQLQHNQSQDTKGVWLFRSNIFLFGLLITGLSLTVSSEAVQPIEFLNLWSLFGGTMLFLSTFLSAFTYSSSSYKFGISAKVIEDTENGEFSDGDLDEEIRSLYRKWINENEAVASFNSYALIGALILVLDSIIMFTGSGIVGILGLRLTIISGVILVISLVILIFFNVLIYYAERYFLSITNSG